MRKTYILSFLQSRTGKWQDAGTYTCENQVKKARSQMARNGFTAKYMQTRNSVTELGRDSYILH